MKLALAIGFAVGPILARVGMNTAHPLASTLLCPAYAIVGMTAPEAIGIGGLVLAIFVGNALIFSAVAAGVVATARVIRRNA